MIRHFVMEYLAQVPLVNRLTALLARIEVFRLVGGFAAQPVSNDLTWLDFLGCASDDRIIFTLCYPVH